MRLHIYGALREYKKRKPLRLHMPGHKADRRMSALFRDSALDVTELSFSDCLESPDGVIARAEEDIAALLGARRSYILTDGSTAGVFAMVYAAKRAGVDEEKAMPMALGLEMLHTATLIHDDLPCMDDDDMRRGKPSNHAKFGETLALLAGDALFVQSLEFPMAKLKGIAPANVLRAMHIFAKAIGPSGVCGGQVLDIDAAKAKDEPDYVRRIAKLKTGALIQAAVLTGAASRLRVSDSR